MPVEAFIQTADRAVLSFSWSRCTIRSPRHFVKAEECVWLQLLSSLFIWLAITGN